MEWLKSIEDFIKKRVKNNNTLYNLIIVFLVGVLILIVTNFFNGSNEIAKSATADAQQQDQPTQSEILNYELSKKTELKNMLSSVQGVGKVDLMIYFESGEELVPALNQNNVNSTTKENDGQGGERNTTQNTNGSQVVITNEGNNSKPLILKKNYPKVTGVMIVAEGAEDRQVQYGIKNAVASLFDISTNKVNVYPMKK